MGSRDGKIVSSWSCPRQLPGAQGNLGFSGNSLVFLRLSHTAHVHVDVERREKLEDGEGGWKNLEDEEE